MSAKNSAFKAEESIPTYNLYILHIWNIGDGFSAKQPGFSVPGQVSSSAKPCSKISIAASALQNTQAIMVLSVVAFYFLGSFPKVNLPRGNHFVSTFSDQNPSKTQKASTPGEDCDSITGYICNPTISRFWGQYSPYFSVPSEVSADVPAQCEVIFAQVISRHGARDPTKVKSQAYRKLIEQIKSRTTKFEGKYAFLEDYEYTLGEDQLTQFGRQQMSFSGQLFYSRYKNLIEKKQPFVRASGQQRVIESAEEWVKGLLKVQNAERGVKEEPIEQYPIVVISENEGMNNTLNHGLCRDFEEDHAEIIEKATASWLESFIPIIQRRINENLKGANVSDLETLYLMDLCPFETVANPEGQLSDFCKLYTEDDWKAYDYLQSIGKYYGYGDGNSLGPTQGVGFVNELIARLSNSAVQDSTSSNSTLDSNPNTFPIGEDYALFADFSHDNDMVGVFSALNLFANTEPMSNSTIRSPQQMKGFAASWAVPFAARAFIEKLQCGQKAEEKVRIILNDRVMPLHGCENDNFRMCKLEDFLGSLDFARDGGRWDRCFE